MLQNVRSNYDTDLFKPLIAFVEQLSGGADERPAGHVLLVAGLFADQHDGWPGRALAEYGLRGPEIKVAAFAAGGSLAEGRKRSARRKKIRGTAAVRGFAHFLPLCRGEGSGGPSRLCRLENLKHCPSICTGRGADAG